MGILSSCQPLNDKIPITSQIPTSQNQPFTTNTLFPTLEIHEILLVASQTPGLAPSPTSMEQQPCSPLMDHSLSTLPQIISQPYNPPAPGSDARHHGIDFFYYQADGQGSIAGEGVQAILPGIVAAVINDRLPYGNMVIIETPISRLTPMIRQALGFPETLSIYHLYAHMNNTPDLFIGGHITCGQIIGQVGQTGYNIPVPHLHLETRLGPPGSIFGTMAFYDTQATTSEGKNYLRWRTSGEFNHFNPMIILAGY